MREEQRLFLVQAKSAYAVYTLLRADRSLHHCHALHHCGQRVHVTAELDLEKKLRRSRVPGSSKAISLDDLKITALAEDLIIETDEYEIVQGLAFGIHDSFRLWRVAMEIEKDIACNIANPISTQLAKDMNQVSGQQ